MLGTVLGVGALVAVLGLTSTATGQIGKSFDLMRDTTVTVNDVGPGPVGAVGGKAPGTATMDFPADTDSRLEHLNGVVSAGVWWTIPLHNPTIAPTADASAAPPEDSSIGLFALSPGALQAMQPTLRTGVLFNQFHQRRSEHVCLLGAAAAHLLGITRVDNRPAIFINDTAYTVLGIVSDSQSLSQTLMGILIPSSTALSAYGPPGDAPAQALIHTRIGAAQLIAHQAPLALRPDEPNLLQAVPPPDPHSLRDQVNGDLSGLFLVLAAICLAIGAVGIANTTLVSVLERTAEIGLRRALGARPRHITAQFLTESTMLGLLGGLLGTSIGVATVLVTSVAQNWTAILQPYTVYPAPLVGAAVGLVAGLYPALRAARIEPLDALRR
jgi:putative ABC transport system permease protein